MTAAETPHKTLDRISDPEAYRVRVYRWEGYWSFEVTGPMVPFRDGGYLSRWYALHAALDFIEGYMRGESLNVAELKRECEKRIRMWKGTNG